MKKAGGIFAVMLLAGAVLVTGCAEQKVDFSSIQRPARSAELDAYNVFVGSWNWEAELVNADAPDKKWTGTAMWHWTMDDHWLHGQITAESERADFDAAGAWGWNQRTKKYVWWMFNNWGFAQEGTASYNEAERCWKMNYESVGLDGTPSYGYYLMKVVDNDNLEWHNVEWADMTHMIKKMEMKGTYKRK